MTPEQAFPYYVLLLADFLVQIAKPAAVAAPLVAIIIDHALKRIPGWKDGNAGWANVILNVLFSAGLYFAAKAGYRGEFEDAIKLSVFVVPTILRLVFTAWVTRKFHLFLLTLGVGKSKTVDQAKAFAKLQAG